MKVLVIPADRHGCGWYRMLWPAEHLQRAGHDVAVRTMFRAGDRVDADVVVMQRILHPKALEFMCWLQDRGVTVVHEIDDDVTALPKHHPMLPELAAHGPGQNVDTFRLACQQADWLTCTTPALATLGRPDRVTVLPNCIPQARIDAGAVHRSTERRFDRPVIGYSGPDRFHLWDIPLVGKGVFHAKAKTNAIFYGIGGQRLPKLFGVDGTADNWRDMHDYGATGFVAGQSMFDVGLVPLMACRFNECKSDLKGLEYAALGIPFIASPTGPYRDLAAAGVGVTARTPRVWREAICEALDDPRPRPEIIDYARTRTFETNHHAWWNTWTQAKETP